jgi:hypothetical protein
MSATNHGRNIVLPNSVQVVQVLLAVLSLAIGHMILEIYCGVKLLYTNHELCTQPRSINRPAEGERTLKQHLFALAYGTYLVILVISTARLLPLHHATMRKV